jgi:hypothetical protein
MSQAKATRVPGKANLTWPRNHCHDRAERTHQFLPFADRCGAIQPDKGVVLRAAEGGDEVERLCVVGDNYDFVPREVPQDVQHLRQHCKLARQRLPS